MYKHLKFGDFMQEKLEIIINNGNLDFKALSKLDISSDELKAAMRKHGVEYFNNVKLATL
jgi:uncharacterized membrane protein YcaP (DUF421 family)